MKIAEKFSITTGLDGALKEFAAKGYDYGIIIGVKADDGQAPSEIEDHVPAAMFVASNMPLRLQWSILIKALEHVLERVLDKTDSPAPSGEKLTVN